MAGKAKVELLLEMKNRMRGGIAKAKQQLSGGINDMKGNLKGLKKNHNDTFDSMMSDLPYFDQFNDKLNVMRGLSAKTGTAGAGLRAMFSSVAGGIRMATKATLTFIATPIGAAIAGLVAIGKAAKYWWDFNSSVASANKELEGITNLTGEAVDEVRIRSQALQDVFKTDFKENAKIARDVSQQFKISYKEAFDIIEDGLIRSGAANDEFFDNFKEYSTFFERAGYSAENLKNIINTGFDMGIYKDKLPDAIKEFGLAVNEQTKTTRDAMVNAFGEQFTNKLFKNVTDGSLTAKEALMQISNQAVSSGLNVQQQAQLTADLFKGAGEDAGGAMKVFKAVNSALKGQNKEYNAIEKHRKNHIEALKEMKQAQDRAFKSDGFSKFANDLKVGWIEIKTAFYNFVGSVREGFSRIHENFQLFKQAFQPIIDLVKSLYGRVKSFFSGIAETWRQSKVGQIFTGFRDKLKDIGIVGKQTDGTLGTIARSIKVVAGVAAGAIGSLKELAKTFIEAFGGIKEAFANFDWSSPIESFKNVQLSKFTGAFSAMGTRMGEAFSDRYNDIVNQKLKKPEAVIKTSGENQKNETNPFADPVPAATQNATATSQIDKITGSAKQVRHITVNIDSFNKGGINTEKTELQHMDGNEIEQWFTDRFMRMIRNFELSY